MSLSKICNIFIILGFLCSCTVKSPPCAEFSVSSDELTINTQITLDASSSLDIDGTIVSFQWDMGDGNTLFGESITYTYNTTGSVTIRLEITDNDGLTDVAEKIIRVNEAPVIVEPTVLKSPVFSWPGGTYYAEKQLEFSCADPNADIFYTLDGTVPETTSLIYTSSITLSQDTTVRAIAWKDGCETSPEVRADYQFVSGAFKLMNSWGTGDWENVPDGHLFITYEAVLQNQPLVYVLEKQEEPDSRLIAEIGFDCDFRRDVSMKLSLESSSGQLIEKDFSHIFQKSANTSLTGQTVSLDISAFSGIIPIDGCDLILSFYDQGNYTGGGGINSFSWKIIQKDGSILDQSSYSKSLPISVTDAGGITLSIPIASSFIIKSLSNVSSLETLIGQRALSLVEESESVAVEKVLIDNHGTGYSRPSFVQEGIHNRSLMENSLPLSDTEIPAYVDWSDSIYFPPVADQGSEGSCAPFSLAYYTLSFYLAREKGVNLSSLVWDDGVGSQQNNICSPDFIYNLVNFGSNYGSLVTDVVEVLSNIGCASLAEFPFDPDDQTLWPSQQAFLDARSHRTTGTDLSPYKDLYVFKIEDVEDIDILRLILSKGYCASIEVDADKYECLTIEDVWHQLYYVNAGTNHLNTVVGYSDDVD